MRIVRICQQTRGSDGCDGSSLVSVSRPFALLFRELLSYVKSLPFPYSLCHHSQRLGSSTPSERCSSRTGAHHRQPPLKRPMTLRAKQGKTPRRRHRATAVGCGLGETKIDEPASPSVSCSCCRWDLCVSCSS